MKKPQTTEIRNPEQFQKMLADRLDALDRRTGTGSTDFHTGTERLLIHLAFDRLRKGEYWTCVKCGEEITVERMHADPTTLMCAGCDSGAKKR